MAGLEWVEEALAELERSGLLRSRRTIAAPGPMVEAEGRLLLNLCSNDYLSLAAEPAAAATSGAGASRLIAGDLEIHLRLESELARWLGYAQTLLFNSGYAANVGALSALAGPDVLVVSDALNHASLIDGCRLARARVEVVPHRDVDAVERVLGASSASRKIVATDAYFSMDATCAPLDRLRAVCDRHGAALYVDEAHGLGVWGDGRGVGARFGARADVLVGTLGKAFGASGAFVACDGPVARWLWNRARSFVFSTGLAPSSAASSLRALSIVERGEATRRLHANAAILRRALGPHASGEGPIVPIPIGDPRRAVAISDRLRERGLLVQAIRPPTVPVGTARLRVTVQAQHDPEMLATAGQTIADEVGP